MKNLYGRNGARHWLSLREGLIVASAIAAAATAQPAHAETLTMICGGYSVAFSPGNLTSHAPKKDRDYPITKVDRQNGRTVVSGKTQYGKITAFFSKDGHSSIVWTNGKDVVLNQCTSETVLATQPPLQERRSAKPDPEDGDMLRNRPPIPMPKAPKQEEKNTDLVTVRNNVTIDWTLRENVRAQLRVFVKRILRKYGYPPDKQEKATQTVLEQAEILSAGWAA